jgi:hypothetical protein
MINEPYDTNITASSAPSYDREEMMDIDDDNGATLNVIQTAASYVDKQKNTCTAYTSSRRKPHSREHKQQERSCCAQCRCLS